MTHRKNRFFYLILGIFCLSNTLTAQSVNFEETWKEFLNNNKISNMSALNKPHKYDDPLNYIKYLLMNTNTNFCQSDVKEAEELMKEIHTIDPKAFKAIPGFLKKMDDLESKIKAYHSMDAIWMQFLDSRTVNLDELESVKAAKSSCEKSTLAKYSYMTVYAHYCQGNVPRAKNILENRTLRLTEKTSLRVEDVEGLGEEVAKMKSLFQDIEKLQASWADYLATGVSPGFDLELPLFPCNPIPNMKEWVLKGAIDVCQAGPKMLDRIRKSQKETGVNPKGDLAKKVKELEGAIAENNAKLKVLNKAWAAFIPDNEIEKEDRIYGYEFCNTEPLIKAYIMDGFANICGNAEDRLEQIDQLRKAESLNLDKVTVTKIDELTAAFMENQTAELDINDYWEQFKAEGDQLAGGYQLADYYCDHIYDVKSWLIQGLSGDCKVGQQYLEQIDEVKKNLEFEFAKDIRCRVEKLRLKVWQCHYDALEKIALVQSADSLDVRMAALIEEYGIGERPVGCVE